MERPEGVSVGCEAARIITPPNSTNLLAEEVADGDHLVVVGDREVDGEMRVHGLHLVLEALQERKAGNGGGGGERQEMQTRNSDNCSIAVGFPLGPKNERR